MTTPQTDATPSRIRAMTAVVIVGTFLCGAAIGAGLSFWALRHRMPPPPFGLPFHELALTAEQDAQVRAILQRHRPELERILRESFPRVRAVNEQIEREVREVLTEAQCRKLDELKARRWPHGRPGMHGGPLFGPPGAGFGPGTDGGIRAPSDMPPPNAKP